MREVKKKSIVDEVHGLGFNRPMITKVKNLINELGAANAFWYLGDRGLRALRVGKVFRYGLYAQPIPSDPTSDQKALARMPENQKLVELKTYESGMADLGIGSAVADYRFAQDSRCLGLCQDDGLIAMAWFCPASYREDEVRCTFALAEPDKSVWDYGVIVHPQHRLGRAFSRLWAGVCQELRSQAIQVSCSRILLFNAPSVRSHARLGAVQVGRATFLILFGIQIFFSRREPYFHISVKGSGPRIPVRPATPVQG